MFARLLDEPCVRKDQISFELHCSVARRCEPDRLLAMEERWKHGEVADCESASTYSGEEVHGDKT